MLTNSLCLFIQCSLYHGLFYQEQNVCHLPRLTLCYSCMTSMSEELENSGMQLMDVEQKMTLAVLSSPTSRMVTVV